MRSQPIPLAGERSPGPARASARRRGTHGSGRNSGRGSGRSVRPKAAGSGVGDLPLPDVTPREICQTSPCHHCRSEPWARRCRRAGSTARAVRRCDRASVRAARPTPNQCFGQPRSDALGSVMRTCGRGMRGASRKAIVGNYQPPLAVAGAADLAAARRRKNCRTAGAGEAGTCSWRLYFGKMRQKSRIPSLFRIAKQRFGHYVLVT
jgi:hypothetical protein